MTLEGPKTPATPFEQLKRIELDISTLKEQLNPVLLGRNSPDNPHSSGDDHLNELHGRFMNFIENLTAGVYNSMQQTLSNIKNALNKTEPLLNEGSYEDTLNAGIDFARCKKDINLLEKELEEIRGDVRDPENLKEAA